MVANINTECSQGRDLFSQEGGLENDRMEIHAGLKNAESSPDVLFEPESLLNTGSRPRDANRDVSSQPFQTPRKEKIAGGEGVFWCNPKKIGSPSRLGGSWSI